MKPNSRQTHQQRQFHGSKLCEVSADLLPGKLIPEDCHKPQSELASQTTKKKLVVTQHNWHCEVICLRLLVQWVLKALDIPYGYLASLCRF